MEHSRRAFYMLLTCIVVFTQLQGIKPTRKSKAYCCLQTVSANKLISRTNTETELAMKV